MSEEQNSEHVDGHADDEAMRRLRAADPAADTSVDADAIRMSVDEKLWTGIGDQVDEVAVQREVRQRRSGGVWLGVAAAACAVALAAGVGFRAGSSSTPTVSAAAPAISLNQSGQPGRANAVAEAGASPALGAPSTSGATLDAKVMPSYFGGMGGRVSYLAAPSLSDQAGTSPGYSYNATAVDGKAAVTALAKALGITGAPTNIDGTWSAGANDGTGANVAVMIDGMRSFYGYDPTADPNACVNAEPAPAVEPAAPDGSASSGSGSSGGSVAGGKETPCAAKGEAAPAPGADAAIAIAKDFMTSVGADPARYEWQADATSSPGYAYVTAFEVVNGRQTGGMWSFGLTGKGRFVSVNGFLAPVIDLGEYPVISPRAAVDRMNDPRFGGFFGGVMPLAVARGGVAMDGTVSSDVATPPAVPTTPPAPMTPGAPFAWPIGEVTITGCELGVAQNYTTDGATVLIPTYLCTGSDGGQYSVVAVADAGLNTTALTAR